MNAFFFIIYLPIVIGIFLFLLQEKTNQTIKGIISLVLSVVVLGFAIRILSFPNDLYDLSILPTFAESANPYFQLHLDGLSKIVVLFSSIFAVLIIIYSIVYNKKHRDLKQYYSYVVITLGCAGGAVLSNNLILFITFWGILGLTLYKLISSNTDESASAGKKTLILIGASDSLMILGIGLIWLNASSFTISGIHLATNTITNSLAFICLLIGAFTKAGAFPFHTWIPDFTKNAPASSSAYLPASLDKLLGIYFMARICMDMFVLNRWLTLIILVIGVTTIIIAVMMALIQHNYKKLLGYHAVSQVGYMVLGIGLGSPLGIAGGLFHMINHALYKSGLFLTAGSIERQTGKEELDEIGGLSKNMPITFISAIIFALAISGVPPLNGFASKWMIYQAIIDFGQGSMIANKLWILWLALAVIGSALTLASFIKFISGAFLGRMRDEFVNVKEVPFMMWLPMALLGITCLVFGIFITVLVIPNILQPIVGSFEFIGTWNSSLITLLILVSIVLGIIIYLAGNIKNFRTAESFIGGETMQDSTSFSVLEFYKTFNEFRLLRFFYNKAQNKVFDVYDQSRNAVLGFNKILSREHTGLLTFYAFWIIAGLLIMMLALLL